MAVIHPSLAFTDLFPLSGSQLNESVRWIQKEKLFHLFPVWAYKLPVHNCSHCIIAISYFRFCAKRWKVLKSIFVQPLHRVWEEGAVLAFSFPTLCPAGQCVLSESSANQKCPKVCSFAIRVSSVLMEALQPWAPHLLPLLWLRFFLTFILCPPTATACRPGLGKVQQPVSKTAKWGNWEEIQNLLVKSQILVYVGMHRGVALVWWEGVARFVICFSFFLAGLLYL